MSLFDFIKEAGASLFGRGRNEVEEITDLLNSTFGQNIENLKVEYSDGVVTLYGSCDSQATKEKAILLVAKTRLIQKEKKNWTFLLGAIPKRHYGTNFERELQTEVKKIKSEVEEIRKRSQAEIDKVRGIK